VLCPRRSRRSGRVPQQTHERETGLDSAARAWPAPRDINVLQIGQALTGRGIRKFVGSLRLFASPLILCLQCIPPQEIFASREEGRRRHADTRSSRKALFQISDSLNPWRFPYANIRTTAITSPCLCCCQCVLMFTVHNG